MSDLFNSFESEEFEDSSQQSEETHGRNDPVSQVMEELDEMDEELVEAEKRLSKAAYYKVISKNGVVEDDGTDEAAEVNAEAALWARKRMADLLGLGHKQEVAQPVSSQFSEQEVLALRKLAERLLTAQGGSPTPEPQVRKVSAPAPMAKRVEAKPALSGKAAAKPLKKKTAAKVDYDSIETGKVFVDPRDNAEYKFVPHPEKDGQRIKLKVSGQVNNKSRQIPMPTPDQLTSISAVQAADSVALATKSGGGNMIAAALKNG